MAATVSGISAANSSTSPLSALAQFTGAALDCSYLVSVSVGCYSDKPFTLIVDQSSDASNWYTNNQFTGIGGVPLDYTFQPVLQYIRVHVVCGTVNMTVLQLQTKYIAQGSASVLAIMEASTGSAQVPVLCDTLGNLKISPVSASAFRQLSASATGAVVKSSQTLLYSISISNSDTSDTYIKLYNKASAPVSSDAPILTLACPGVPTIGAIASVYCQTYSFPAALFSLGLGIRATTTAEDAASTSNTANTVIVNLFYV